MSTVRSSIFAKIVERLEATDAAQEVELMPPGDPVLFPAFQILDNGHEKAESETLESRYYLSVTIDGYVEDFEAADASSQLDLLYAHAVRALMPEPPLDGLAETIDEGDMRVFVAAGADKRRLGFSLDFTIGYASRRDDPAEPA